MREVRGIIGDQGATGVYGRAIGVYRSCRAIQEELYKALNTGYGL